jgi:hypothetical protein
VPSFFSTCNFSPQKSLSAGTGARHYRRARLRSVAIRGIESGLESTPRRRNSEQQQGLESMPRREMISRRASRTLLSRMGKVSKERSMDGRGFRSPPLWIHVSQAGRWLFSPREARKRAVIRLLDDVENRGQTPPVKTGV